jgi:hypothetical protein
MDLNPSRIQGAINIKSTIPCKKGIPHQLIAASVYFQVLNLKEDSTRKKIVATKDYI